VLKLGIKVLKQQFIDYNEKGPVSMKKVPGLVKNGPIQQKVAFIGCNVSHLFETESDSQKNLNSFKRIQTC